MVFPASVGVRMVRRKSHATPTITTKHGDQTCNGGLQSYCCAGFKPAPFQDKIKNDATDAAKGAAERVAKNAALDVAAKAFCRSRCAAGEKKRAPCLSVETQWGTTTSDILTRTTKTCSGNQYTQACFHYQSVIREYLGYGTLTCPYNKALRAARLAVALYDAQHNGDGSLDGCKDPACPAKETNILPLIPGKAAVASSGSISSPELIMKGQDPR